jgi:Gene product 88
MGTTMNKLMTIKAARAIAGTLGYPSKMPGTSYGISAHACKTGGKLAKVAGSTCHGCYALKANYQYPSVAQAHAKRLAGIVDPAWSVAMVTLLLAAHKNGKGRNGRFAKNWHRWHDSGDLQSIDHLTKICAVAAMTPRIKHWLPTRELSIVKAYVAAGGVVPANLVIRNSATMVDGPATSQWPTTSGVHDKAAPPAGTHVCPAPKQEGKCGPCRACWSHDVKHVSYRRH